MKHSHIISSYLLTLFSGRHSMLVLLERRKRFGRVWRSLEWMSTAIPVFLRGENHCLEISLRISLQTLTLRNPSIIQRITIATQYHITQTRWGMVVFCFCEKNLEKMRACNNCALHFTMVSIVEVFFTYFGSTIITNWICIFRLIMKVFCAIYNHMLSDRILNDLHRGLLI